MSIVEKFFGAPEVIEIEGEKVNVYPMAAEDILLFKKGATMEEQLDNQAELIRRCLRDEKLTVDQIKKFNQGIYMLLLDKIDAISSSVLEKDESAVRRIKDKIARSQIKQQESTDAGTS